MRKIECPTDSPNDVYDVCIRKVKNASLKARLEGVKNLIQQASEDFHAAAGNGSLHQIASHGAIGAVTTEEMVAVYNYRMAKKGSAGRGQYDKLMSAPEHGRCPMCGQRVVTTLDHFLPKSRFPSLAVTPCNLVPCCKDCNDEKGDRSPLVPHEQLLHPYFDDIEEEIWLKAEVVSGSPACIRFFVEPPAYWHDVLKSRVSHHFISLKLSSLYASHAAEELISIRHGLKTIYESGAGAVGVKESLLQQAESRSMAKKNSWQTALYVALDESDWFCDGGFAA